MTDEFKPGGWFPDDCVITLEKKGGATTTVTTDVTNFAESGGERDVESAAHFGGAKVTIKKPQGDFEVSFDIGVNDTFWADVLSGSITTAGSATKVSSDGTHDDFKIKLEWRESTIGSSGYKLIYYNANGVSYEKSNPVDSYLTGTVNFKLASKDNIGSGQKFEIECTDFSDTGGSGSYVGWETLGDTLFGF